MDNATQLNPAESDGFYRAFEERFRGSRDLIKSRLRAYLPFLEPLKLVGDSLDAVDLGCGRGEWLEFLEELGFKAVGVDLDDGMLSACHERGLSVSRGDAINFLRDLPDSSQIIVSGFHLAEHLPFPELRHLVREALRVLQPGGLLILETPNPENVNVAGNTFHLDPTHQSPLPPGLLSFLPDYYGFARVKVVRLQERQDLLKAPTASLWDVLTGVSPDYSIVAQKEASDDLAEITRPAFEAEYGLTLDRLVGRFDAQNAQQVARTMDLAKALERVSEALAQEVAHKNAVIEAREAEIAQLKKHISDANNDAGRQKHELVSLKQQVASLYDSTSWKVTKPLRLLSRLVQWFARGGLAWVTMKPGSRPRRVISSLFARDAKQPNHSQAVKDIAASDVLKTNLTAEPIHVSDDELKIHARRSGLIVLDQIDTITETESVQRVYQQLTAKRKHFLKNT
jgi:SAM-dependent methyltransferase